MSLLEIKTIPAKGRSQVLFENTGASPNRSICHHLVVHPESGGMCQESALPVSISTDTSGAFHKHQDLRQITPL